MKILREKTTDSAVVGVVTAILIVGLIVAVVSLVQTMYIPKIMEQREAEHMEKVAEQFTYLTSVIDGQAANPENNMPIATSISLGSKELPYMLSMKAYGTLEILDNPLLDNARSLMITNDGGSKEYTIGVITYSSSNAYFLNQNYTYEAGAMIVSQYDGNLIMIRPNFFAAFNDSIDDTFDISFDVVNISCVGEKSIASGFGVYPIQTEFSKKYIEATFFGVTSITITTPLSNAWSVFLRNTLNRAGLTEGEFQVTDTAGKKVVVDNFSSSYSVRVILRIININAQIGPGWVE